MAQEKQSWIKSPWAIGIGCALIGSLFSVILSQIKGVSIFSTLSELSIWAWKSFLSIMNFELKVWWLLLLFICLLLLIIVIRTLNSNSSNKPIFYNYQSDTLKNCTWRWNWEYNQFHQRWEIKNLCATCPYCETPMTGFQNQYNEIHFECPRCEYRSERYSSDTERKVYMLIYDNADKMSKSKEP